MDLDDLADLQHPSSRRAILALVVLLALVGLALRLWALGRQPVSSDEAVVALMAREILHGHFFAFYWGQNYGGVEPYVVAPMFALFGQSGFTLGLTPVLLDAVCAVLIAGIGRRLFSLRVGVAAALLFWLWPEVYIWQSTLEYGFRWVALVCGLAVMLLSLRLLDPQSTRRRLAWGALGLFTGIGWWATPEIAYFVVPSALVIGYRLARRRFSLSLAEVLAAVVAFFVGSLPWWWANIRSGFDSFHSGVLPSPSFLSHMKAFVVHAVPMLLGLQLPIPAPHTTRWLDGATVAGGLSILIVAGGVFWLAVLALSGRASLLVWFAVVFPFLYARSPFTWYWLDGRYAVFLAPAAALLAVSAAEQLGAWLSTRTTWRAASVAPLVAVFCLALATTGWGVFNKSPFSPDHESGSPEAGWTNWSTNATGYVASLASHLESVAPHFLYAGYWVSYPLDLESGGRLTVSDARYARYEPLLVPITAAARPGWLFIRPSRRGAAEPQFTAPFMDPGCAATTDRCLDARELELYLREHRVAYRTITVGDFVVVVPARAVDAQAVLARFGILPLTPSS